MTNKLQLTECGETPDAGEAGTVHLPGMDAHDHTTFCGYCWTGIRFEDTDKVVTCSACIRAAKEASEIIRAAVANDTLRLDRAPRRASKSTTKTTKKSKAQPPAEGEIRVVREGATPDSKLVHGTCPRCRSKMECRASTASVMQGDRPGEPSSLYVFCTLCKRAGYPEQHVWLKGKNDRPRRPSAYGDDH